MIVRRSTWIALVCALVLDLLIGQSPLAAVPQRSDEQVKQEMAGLAWQRGPVDGRIGTVATLKIGEGQAFLDGPNTRRFLELNGNPPRDDRYALVASQWFAIFFFENAGYVKDDEKLDAAALLASMKQIDRRPTRSASGWGCRRSHRRMARGAPLRSGSKRLEWGVRLRGEGGRTIVNYSIRLLGRRGVMHAVLVSDRKAWTGISPSSRRRCVTMTSRAGSATRSSGPAIGSPSTGWPPSSSVARRPWPPRVASARPSANSSSWASPPSARRSWLSTAG